MHALIALALVAPVPGDVVRGFDYAGDPFARGHHRGVDLAAAPGAPVRAACGGRVVFAGRAGANRGVVTIRCGRWNVTHLPLATVAAHAGAKLPAGSVIGTAGRARGHAGLHIGVRRAADRLGYVDPAPLLRAPPRHAPPAALRTRPRRPAPPPVALRTRQRRPAPPPVPEPPPLVPVARPAPTGSSPPLAPWPAWAGLALLLSGAAGAGTARARRRRHAARRHASAAPVR